MRKLLVLLLVATVAAQSPSLSGVEIRSDVAELDVSVDGVEELMLRVTNTASGGSPSDQPNRIVLQVDGIPRDWTAEVRPNELNLLPGETGSVTLFVSVTPSATVGATTLTVTATSFSPAAPFTEPGGQVLDPLGPVLDPLSPVTDPATGDVLEPTGQASVDIAATRADDLTRQVLESVGIWIWAVLGALFILTLLMIVLFVAKRRGGLRVSIREEKLEVRAGHAADATILVENPSRIEQTVTVEAVAGDKGIRLNLAARELVIEPYTSQEIVMEIVVPSDATVGEHKIGITAGTTGRLHHKAEAIVHLNVKPARKGKN